MTDTRKLQTVVGPDTILSGEVNATEDVVVFGHLKGRLKVDAVLFVEKSGLVEADVVARHAVVAGRVVGTIQVKDCLEVTSTGIIEGAVAAPRLVVNDGARLKATLSMSNPTFNGKAKSETARTSITAPAKEQVKAPEAAPKAAARTVYTYNIPVRDKTREVEPEEKPMPSFFQAQTPREKPVQAPAPQPAPLPTLDDLLDEPLPLMLEELPREEGDHYVIIEETAPLRETAFAVEPEEKPRSNRFVPEKIPESRELEYVRIGMEPPKDEIENED